MQLNILHILTYQNIFDFMLAHFYLRMFDAVILMNVGYNGIDARGQSTSARSIENLSWIKKDVCKKNKMFKRNCPLNEKINRVHTLFAVARQRNALLIAKAGVFEVGARRKLWS